MPWVYAGKEVSVREQADQVEVRSGGERIAIHARATTQHQVITLREHHQGIPLGNNQPSGKTLIHIQHGVPVVENRPLAAYEAVFFGSPKIRWWRCSRAVGKISYDLCEVSANSAGAKMDADQQQRTRQHKLEGPGWDSGRHQSSHGGAR